MTDRPVTTAALAGVDVRELAAELATLIGAGDAHPLLTAAEAGALLGVPKTWLLGEARAGRVPHVRLGKYVRFVQADLLAWVEERKQGPGARRSQASAPRLRRAA